MPKDPAPKANRNRDRRQNKPRPEKEEPRQEGKVVTPRAQALAAVTLKLVPVIREVFPVEGMPWSKAGEGEAVATRPFRKLLKDFAPCWWVLNDKGRKEIEPTKVDTPELYELVHAWRDLFQHYGWVNPSVFINGRLNPIRKRWFWPDAPLLPKDKLERLERAALNVLSIAQVADVDKIEDPAFDLEDLNILRALLKSKPQLLTQDVIEAEAEVSRRTISGRIQYLLSAGLVHQPRGEKSGTTITKAGEALLRQIGSPPDVQ
jgi:hypothetical protein